MKCQRSCSGHSLFTLFPFKCCAPLSCHTVQPQALFRSPAHPLESQLRLPRQWRGRASRLPQTFVHLTTAALLPFNTACIAGLVPVTSSSSPGIAAAAAKAMAGVGIATAPVVSSYNCCKPLPFNTACHAGLVPVTSSSSPGIAAAAAKAGMGIATAPNIVFLTSSTHLLQLHAMHVSQALFPSPPHPLALQPQPRRRWRGWAASWRGSGAGAAEWRAAGGQLGVGAAGS